MHPYLMELLADQRENELRRSQPRRAQVTRPGARRSVRRWAGWTLVAVGLRLAGTSASG